MHLSGMALGGVLPRTLEPGTWCEVGTLELGTPRVRAEYSSNRAAVDVNCLEMAW